jgi:hypothetical protein
MTNYAPRLPGDVQECPRCMYTMELLRESNLMRRDYGVSLDYSLKGWNEGDGVLSDLISSFFGNMRNRRLQRIAALYPNSLICPHCEYVLKRR